MTDGVTTVAGLENVLSGELVLINNNILSSMCCIILGTFKNLYVKACILVNESSVCQSSLKWKELKTINMSSLVLVSFSNELFIKLLLAIWLVLFIYAFCHRFDNPNNSVNEEDEKVLLILPFAWRNLGRLLYGISKEGVASSSKLYRNRWKYAGRAATSLYLGSSFTNWVLGSEVPIATVKLKVEVPAGNIAVPVTAPNVHQVVTIDEAPSVTQHIEVSSGRMSTR